jgi:hypothetical protein
MIFELVLDFITYYEAKSFRISSKYLKETTTR